MLIRSRNDPHDGRTTIRILLRLLFLGEDKVVIGTETVVAIVKKKHEYGYG